MAPILGQWSQLLGLALDSAASCFAIGGTWSLYMELVRETNRRGIELICFFLLRLHIDRFQNPRYRLKPSRIQPSLNSSDPAGLLARVFNRIKVL